MEQATLSFGGTLKESIAIGLKNSASILGCVLLWLVTIWIPWINVGTTIAIINLPIELSKGRVISPLSIFDAKYRKYFGEVFMTYGLMVFPIVIAYAFMFFPAIVLSLAWKLSVYLVIDKEMNPMSAISASNKATYGSKWVMFLVAFVLGLIVIVAGLILFLLLNSIGVNFLTFLIMFIFAIIALSVFISFDASIYRQLNVNVQP